MAKRFSSTETRDELSIPAIRKLCQDACQRLMLHPYITAKGCIHLHCLELDKTHT